jgi:Tol biopolymer transport system component
MTRFLVAVALLLVTRTSLAAQIGDPLSPDRPWRTLETEHFIVHFPADKAEWTLPVAARLDSVHSAVVALTGNAPPRRTTVVVVDPFNVSNGFAIPFLRSPTMVLWPTPPEPRTGIGEHRDWGELLAVHEYAHLAHLAWPSRNVRDRWLWSLLPAQLGPITRRSPRWVIEGYATYVEGRLTGTGRPHGAWRPATLRQWALEGRLPTYSQLSAWDAFQGGAMAYLVGSAFLEWLVAQRGEESLNHLWRRLTAVQRRSFGDAFAGVFGAPPDELYGRFTVEVMREALEAERLLTEAGLAEGEQFQRLGWHTGDPAVSPDGSHLALVLRQRGRPSRVVVWTTEPPEPLVKDEERERLLERDPLDVPAIEWRPRPKEPVATLHPIAGRGHDHPRFLPDGRRLLVVRAEPLPDGRMRTDLFVWDHQRDDLRRVTHGAGIRHPDPSADGQRAVAVRCEAGICDLVRVELRTGAMETLHRGAPDVVFYRPRYAPGGGQVAVAVQEAGRWRIALTDDAGAPLRYLDPDDGHNRYDAAWLPGGEALVVVSHRGGVANLERIDVATGSIQPLTRTTGAALAPAPSPADGSIFFLRLHARGLDVNRLPPDEPAPTGVVDLERHFVRVAPSAPALVPDTFPIAPLPMPRAYGLGPQALRLLPGGGWGVEGGQGVLTLAGTDPIGRLSWTLNGVLGEPGTWRGGGLEAAWRGSRPRLHGNLWWARQSPSRQDPAPAGVAPLNSEYSGGSLWLETQRIGSRDRQSARLGASLGWLEREFFERSERRFVFADAEAAVRLGGRSYVRPSLELHASAGRTAGGDWRRGLVRAGVGMGRGAFGLGTEVTYGAVNGDIDAFESFVVGGAEPLVFNPLVLPQRFTLPSVPLGTLAGNRLLAVEARASLGLLQAFFLAASPDGDARDWYRVVGAHRSATIGPAPLARLPAVRITGGVGYPLDEPYRHRLQAYLLLGFQP